MCVHRRIIKYVCKIKFAKGNQESTFKKYHIIIERDFSGPMQCTSSQSASPGSPVLRWGGAGGAQRSLQGVVEWRDGERGRVGGRGEHQVWSVGLG